MIKNDVMLNEELDPKLMIQKLKREILQLKEELAMATGEQRTDDLSAEDLERLVDLHMGGSRGGDRGPDPSPLENHKNIGFLEILVWIP